MAVNKTKQIKDPQKGHGLATTFNVLPGDVLIQITSPYLLVVEKESLSKVCSYCLLEAKAKTVSLQRCSKCRVPRYCSSKCQTRHWKSIHKQECPLLQELPNIPPTAVRGVIQLLLRHRYGTSLDPKWAGLESHVDELKSSGERWNDSIMQANAAVHFAKQSPELSGVAIHMLSRMSCNAFRATLPNQTPVGLCFEPAMAIANHSCDPNACVNFDGRTISLVALSPIEENEQIYISYIDPDDDRDSRRTLLKSQYFFDCDCPRCGDTGDPS